MVSKAREDLPEPERPVTTVSVFRGIETETLRRLCCRAPRTVMCVMPMQRFRPTTPTHHARSESAKTLEYVIPSQEVFCDQTHRPSPRSAATIVSGQLPWRKTYLTNQCTWLYFYGPCIL